MDGFVFEVCSGMESNEQRDKMSAGEYVANSSRSNTPSQIVSPLPVQDKVAASTSVLLAPVFASQLSGQNQMVIQFPVAMNQYITLNLEAPRDASGVETLTPQ